MSFVAYIKPQSLNAYSWACKFGEAANFLFGEGSLEEFLSEKPEGRSDVTLVVPAESVAFHRVSYESAEKRLLAKTVPYNLEEKLLNDVEDLHFSLGPAHDGEVDVAVVSDNTLQELLQQFDDKGIDVSAVIPEQLLAPVSENTVTLLVDEERWLVKLPNHAGFALAPDVAAHALQIYLNEQEFIPEQVNVYGDTQLQDSVESQLPDLLKSNVHWMEQAYWLTLTSAKPRTIVNLLQGSYARTFPFKKLWSFWRLALVLLLAGLIINAIADSVSLSRLKSENMSIRSNIEETYRSVVPKGAMVDPTAQLRRKLAALQGTGSTESLMPRIYKIGSAIDSVKGVKLRAFNFSDKKREIRITFLADQFKDVEAVRAAIQSLGLKAELEGSSAEGDTTRARLRISG